MFVPRGCSVPSKHRAGGRSNRHSIRAPLCRLTMVPMRAVLRSNVDRPPHTVSGVGGRRTPPFPPRAGRWQQERRPRRWL
jgi:hypothetical protein